MTALLIEYNEDGPIFCNDGGVEGSWAHVLRVHDWTTPIISSELLLNRARIALVRGEIDSLTIRFKNDDIPVSPDGTLPHWPKGLADKYIDQLNEIIDGIKEKTK